MRLEVEDRWHDLQVDHGVLMAFYTQFGTKYIGSKFWDQTRLAGCKFLEDKEIPLLSVWKYMIKLTICFQKKRTLDLITSDIKQTEYHLRQRMTDNSDEPYRMLGHINHSYRQFMVLVLLMLITFR